MLAQCNKIVYYKLRLQKGRCVMDFTVIILVFIIILQLAVIFMLYRSRAGAVDEKDLAELVRHFEATERRMYEGLRDLRSEQATLAVRRVWKTSLRQTVCRNSLTSVLTK